MSPSNSKRSNPWLFFALTYGWSWLFWIPAALIGRGSSASSATPLHYLGGIGPAVAAIALLYLTRAQEGRRDYWRRVIDFKRIGAEWYGAIFLTVPLLTVLAALVDLLLSGSGVQLGAPREWSTPLAVVPFAIFALLFGPLPEELGWRGYALDGLQARWSALASSLILGTAWSLWHLPLFFIPGTYQNGLGIGTLSFWLFVIGPISQSVLMTWIYNNTQRSTLSAVLFHFMINLTGELFDLTMRAALFQELLWIAAAVAVPLIWEAKMLTGQREGGK